MKSAIAQAGPTVASRMGARIGTIVFLVVVSRWLDVQDYGDYSYLIGLALTVTVLADSGVSLVLGREVAAERVSAVEAVRAGLPIVAAVNGVAGVAVVVVGRLALGDSLNGIPVLGLGAFVALSGTFALVANVLRSQGGARDEAAIQLCITSGYAAVGIAVVVSGLGVGALMLCFAGKEIVGAAACAWRIKGWRGAGRPSARASWSPRTLLRQGLVLTAVNALFVGYARIALLVVANMDGSRETAMYGAASRFAELGMLLGSTVGFALMPALTRELGRTALVTARRVAFGLFATGAILGASAFPFAGEIVPLVFGEAYADAVAPARVLLIGMPALLLAPYLSYTVFALHRRPVMVRMNVIGFGVAAVCVVPLVGAWGALGAAIATVCAFTAAAAVGVRGLLGSERGIAKTPLISGLPMVGGLAAAALVGFGTVGGGWAAADVSGALQWLVLGFAGFGGAWICVREWRAARPFSLMMLVGLFTVVNFVGRPAYLLANTDDLTAFDEGPGGVQSLAALRSQEVALFTSEGRVSSIPDVINRGMWVGYVFALSAAVGYYACRRRRATRWASDGRELRSERVRGVGLGSGAALVIAGVVVVGLVAQARVVARAGGVSGAIESMLSQNTLQSASFLETVAAGGVAVAGLVLLARGLTSGGTGTHLGLLLLVEAAAYGFMTGSRSRMLLPLVWALVALTLSGRVRQRQLLTAIAAMAVLAGAVLGVRQGAYGQGLEAGGKVGVQAAMSVPVALNDAAVFDAVYMLVASEEGNRPLGGALLVRGLVGFLPGSVIGKAKPEGEDVWFRKRIWEERFQAGRPMSLPGQLWADFRVPGVIVGGLVVGWFGALVSCWRAVSWEGLVVQACGVTLMWALLNGTVGIFAAALVSVAVPLSVLGGVGTRGFVEEGEHTKGSRVRVA